MKKAIISFLLPLILLHVLSASVLAQEEPANNNATEAAPAASEEYKPGITRYEPHGESYSYHLATEFTQNRDNANMDYGIPLYQPADPQPFNAYILMHDDCMGSNSQFGMFSVAEQGATYMSLLSFTNAFEKQSEGVLMVVPDPESADILIMVNQQFPFYDTYYSENGTAVSSYACRVTFHIVRLSDPTQNTSVSLTQYPPDTVYLGSVHDFWEDPPEFLDTPEFENCVNTILGWYGYGGYVGAYGNGIKYAQQTMIDRGFLEGEADGSFGPATESAVKRLQEFYGLEQTGTILDRETLMAIYYEQSALDYMLRINPKE